MSLNPCAFMRRLRRHEHKGSLTLLLSILLLLFVFSVPDTVCAHPIDPRLSAFPDSVRAVHPRFLAITEDPPQPSEANLMYPLDPLPVPADSQWWDGFMRPGTNGIVAATTIFDGDLLVGGYFEVAGGVWSYGAAGWDGAEWSAIAGEISNVEALAVYDGKLYAGKMGSCGASLLRVWEGTSWGVPGEGIRAWDDWDYPGSGCTDYPDWVSALQVYDGKLYAGGQFWQWEGSSNPGRCLAVWNGYSWSSLGSAPDLPVEAMTVYDGKLIIGGHFRQVGDLPASRIAAWDGSSWSALGTGINEEIEYGRSVYALTEYEGNLIAGGVFNEAGGIAVDRLASWDGSAWNSIGFEAGGYVGDNVPAVFALAVYDGKLIVGGRFEKAEGAAADNIAAWNGSAWEELGSGVSDGVFSLICYGDVLVACGGFGFADGKVVYNTAVWDGEAWHPMGSGQGINRHTRTLTLHDGKLVAGGDFTIAGETPANNVAVWDGAGWAAMDEGWSRPKAEALLSVDGDLFGKHGTVIKRWTGISWETYTADFGEGMRTMEFYEGRLAAAGAKVALWNGLSWEPLGPASNGYVKALLAVDGHLIAGGHFTEIGGVEARNVARWDGVEWSPMGDGLLLHSGYRFDEEGVSSLGLYGGDILAGGNFYWSGNTLVKSIARWDGEAWQPLYKGVARDIDPEIYAFCIYNGTLIAGGDFRWAGDFPAWNIARWNGASWSPMGSGIGVFYRDSPWSTARYIVDDLAVYQDDLYAAGFFNYTGGKSSCHIARWRDAFPGMVMHFRGTASVQNVQLVWTNPEASVFRGTMVRYSLDSHPLERDDGEPVPNGNGGVFEGEPGSETSFVLPGVAWTTYYLTAWAYDDAFNYSTPAFATVTAWDSVPPPAHPHFEAAAGSSEVRLAWTNPGDTDFAGTLIRFSRETYPTDMEDGEPVPNGSDGVFEAPAGAAESFMHEELDLDSAYYYTAWAFDEGSNYSDPSYAVATPADPPGALPVAAFSASNVFEGVLLEWTNPAGEGFQSTTLRFSALGYPAHRLAGEPVPNGNDGVFTGAPGSESTFVHTGLTGHTLYYYSAWALYDDGTVSMPVSLFKKAPDTTPPDPPVSFAAVGIPLGTRLHWRNAEDLDVKGVLIRFAEDTYPATQTDGEPLPNGNDGFFDGVSGSYGSFVHTDLLSCRLYYYTAWAYDEFMRYSDPVRLSYLSPIDTVQYFAAIPGDESVRLSWVAPADEMCEYHEAVMLRYSDEGAVYTTEDGAPVENGNDGKFVISRKHDLYTFKHLGVEPGTTYYYSAFVISENPDRASIPVIRTAVPIKILPAVTTFYARGQDRSMRLTWTAPAVADLEAVQIRYSTEAPPESLGAGLAVENGNEGVFAAESGAQGAFTHTGLANGTTYYYSIWAFDEAGFRSEPKHAQAVPFDNEPPDLKVFVMQNPYISEHLDIYMLSSEEVIADSVCVRVAADTVSMSLVSEAYNVWRGDYTLTAPAASISLVACACDLAGNKWCAMSDFAAAYLVAGLGGEVSSPDGRFRVKVPAGAISGDAFVVVMPVASDEGSPYPGMEPGPAGRAPLVGKAESRVSAYCVSPVGLLQGSEASLELVYDENAIGPGISPDRIYIEHEDLGPLFCYVDPEHRVVKAKAGAFGTFRLATGEPGASHLIDPVFLRVGSPRPNPFTSETTVDFEIRATQHVSAVVYDIAGREVSHILDRVLDPGQGRIAWKGEGPTGRAPSGVYFLKVSTGKRSTTRKMLLLR